MHDMPDTEDEDAAAERYWPDAYKNLIRTRLSQTFTGRFQEADAFQSVYEKHYKDRFDGYDRFVERLAEMVVIGAENGADAIFEEITFSFRHDVPLPEKRIHCRYFWPEPFSETLKNELHQKVVEEFRNHHAYIHIHEDHHCQSNLSFDEFIDRVAVLLVAGATNGADDTLGRIYRSFLTASPLPPSRRRPRRLR